MIGVSHSPLPSVEAPDRPSTDRASRKGGRIRRRFVYHLRSNSRFGVLCVSALKRIMANPGGSCCSSPRPSCMIGAQRAAAVSRGGVPEDLESWCVRLHANQRNPRYKDLVNQATYPYEQMVKFYEEVAAHLSLKTEP